ncbi:MAG: MaoC family dehydratase [Bdellovibrionaceae bacterium]|nr:MaoC family dehydratase [Pseudobdellovibrionaceae bacterium]
MTPAVGTVITEKITITDEMIRKFAEVSGDYNPIHMDEEYAKKSRFGRRIAHGMLSAAFISRVLAMKIGHGGIYLGQTLKFMQPIFIGDEITLELTLTNFRAERGLAFVETIVKNQAGDVCVKGDATIMSPDAIKKS